jgi:hypothetical protein
MERMEIMAEESSVAGAKAVLAEYLARCQESALLCLQRGDEHEDPEQHAAAARLIKSSIELVQAIEGKKLNFTYRFVDERKASNAPEADPSEQWT